MKFSKIYFRFLGLVTHCNTVSLNGGVQKNFDILCLNNIFLGFAPFFKTAKESPIKIDNLGFKLFYRFTAGFMFLSTAFCGMSEMFGKNIECFSQEGKVSAAPNIVNQYCFVRNIIIIGVIIH